MKTQLEEILQSKVDELELLKAEASARETQPSAFIRRVKEIVAGAALDPNTALVAVGRLQEAIRAYEEPDRVAKRIVGLRAEIERLRGGLPS
jgi:hypothetical protein